MLDGMIQNEWFNQTMLHPLGLVAIGVLGLLMLLLPRRYAMIPFLIMVCFMSPAQRIVVLTLDFTLIRVIVLFGWLRIILRGEGRDFTWQTLDKVVLLWAFSGTIAMMLLHGTIGVFIYRLGLMFDAVGMSALCAKSEKLTGYLQYLLSRLPADRFEVITPREPARRGCQLSILIHDRPREYHRALLDAGVVCDFREPNVVRVAPVPLYNTFHEVWRFAEALAK
ncbi:MAG: hypothetical protein IIA33_04365 [Planctomycetes bacterium]|nr:hypothetical protein [Planctomycetota bacterium]